MTRYKIEMFIETDADPSTLLSVATDLAAALADDLETYDSEATAFEELTCVSEMLATDEVVATFEGASRACWRRRRRPSTPPEEN